MGKKFDLTLDKFGFIKLKTKEVTLVTMAFILTLKGYFYSLKMRLYK